MRTEQWTAVNKARKGSRLVDKPWIVRVTHQSPLRIIVDHGVYRKSDLNAPIVQPLNCCWGRDGSGKVSTFADEGWIADAAWLHYEVGQVSPTLQNCASEANHMLKEVEEAGLNCNQQ